MAGANEAADHDGLPFTFGQEAVDALLKPKLPRAVVGFKDALVLNNHNDHLLVLEQLGLNKPHCVRAVDLVHELYPCLMALYEEDSALLDV